jgi:hypothetical protein
MFDCEVLLDKAKKQILGLSHMQILGHDTEEHYALMYRQTLYATY